MALKTLDLKVDIIILDKKCDDVSVVKFLLDKAEAKRIHKSYTQRNNEVDKLITSLFLSGDIR